MIVTNYNHTGLETNTLTKHNHDNFLHNITDIKFERVLYGKPTHEYDGTMCRNRRRRLAICWQFLHVFGCPDEKEWEGQDGTIMKITEKMNILVNSKIDDILLGIVYHTKRGLLYLADRLVSEGSNLAW